MSKPTDKEIEAAIKSLIEKGLVKQDGDLFTLTKLGVEIGEQLVIEEDLKEEIKVIH